MIAGQYDLVVAGGVESMTRVPMGSAFAHASPIGVGYAERYGPAALSNTEFARVRRRFLRVYYWRLLWWQATGRGDIVSRDLKRLRERGHTPNLWDFIEAVAAWPVYLFNKRVRRPHAARRWPEDAAKIVA